MGLGRLRMTDITFVPQPTRQRIVTHAIALATKTAARRRKDVDIDIRRTIPKWAKPLRKPARYKGSSGGRGSGKSHFFAEEAVEEMVEDPTLRFLCIREVQSSLKFSAKSLIESKIRQLGVEHLFEIVTNEIRHVDGTGVMIFEGMQDHTADSIKSLEGFRRCWVEEAQKLSERSLKLLLPTIRADDSEIWFSWNPEQPTDPVDVFFRELGLDTPGVAGGGDYVRVYSTYRDNPHCPDVTRKEAERLKALDPEEYEHVYGGGYDLGGKGRVYSSFSGKDYPLGNVDASIEDTGGELLIGQDFNVNPMASVIGVRAGDELLILDALEIESSNTEEVAAEYQQRYPNRRIVVCPDPAGRQRHSSAKVGTTDFTILQNAGFEVRAPNKAPPVPDRVNNANKMYLDLDTGRRRVRIHPRAEALITALKQLTFKEGTRQPDKSKGLDHVCDAADYLMWQEFNVLAPAGSYGRSTHRQ